MPVAKRTCRVCGKTYEACRTANRNAGVFHWQEIACSPECGAVYFQRVNEARNPAPKARRVAKAKKAAENVAEVIEETVVISTDTPEASDITEE